MDRRRFSCRLVAAGLVAALATGTVFSLHANAAEALTIVAPAKPGGGWDQTARAMETVLQGTNLATPVTVENIAGAGGTVGLAQLADKYSGRGDVLMVSGLVMVGSILTNKSPVSLDQTAPVARLTGEYEVLVVPANSEIKSLADIVTKLKADPGSVAWGGGSAGGTDHILAAMIAKAAGVDGSKVNYVPFSGGGEALAAISAAMSRSACQVLASGSARSSPASSGRLPSRLPSGSRASTFRRSRNRGSMSRSAIGAACSGRPSSTMARSRG